MKKLTIAGMILAAAVAAPAAASEKSKAVTACKAEIKAVLGEDARVSLRKIRNYRSDLRISLRVRQPGVDATTVNCIYGDETLAFQTKAGDPLELAELIAMNPESSDTAIN